VAIIALLISILLPSLKQARDISKMMVCQSHLKEIGNALTMYTVDFKDKLPGPIHPVFLKYPQKISGGNKWVFDSYLNTKLRKYFSETKFGHGGTTSQIGTCPSFPVADNVFDGAGIEHYNYALNTSDITAPNFYFGFTHGGIQNYEEWWRVYGDTSKFGWKHHPKTMSRVTNGLIPAKEWVLADAFRRPLPKGYATNWPTEAESGLDIFPAASAEQNWEWGSLSPSVQRNTVLASGQVAPHKPFHPSKGGFKRVNIGGAQKTVFTGKVNTLYFDMHAEAQEGWRGTTVWSALDRFKDRLDR